MATIVPTVSTAARDIGSVQPATAKTEATPSSVTSVIPEVGCDETPTMPTMRAATVTKRTPKRPTPAAQISALGEGQLAAEDAGHERRDGDHGGDAAEDEAAGQVAVGLGRDGRRTSALPAAASLQPLGDRAEGADHRREVLQHGEDAGGRHGAGADVAHVARTRCRPAPCRRPASRSPGRAARRGARRARR